MNIAVIGAGLSGLFTAQGLKNLGHDVVVFEKSRGSGGRMSTKRLAWGHIDMGAQYFSAIDPAFKQVVQSWIKLGWCAQWDFIPYRVHNGVIEPCDVHRSRYTGIGGMSNITSGLSRAVTTAFNTQVERIAKAPNGWQLWDNSGELLGTFDWLICSQPAEQTYDLIKDHCDIASYIPLPVHDQCWAYACATIGECRDDIKGIYAETELNWVSRQSSKPGYDNLLPKHNIWLMHFDNQWSKDAGPNAPIGLLRQLALQWLKKYVNQDIHISHCISHYWRYARTLLPSQTTPALVDSEQRIACAGAWAAGDNVEGAFLSSRYLLNYFEYTT